MIVDPRRKEDMTLSPSYSGRGLRVACTTLAILDLLAISVYARTVTHGEGLHEYCQWETFNATCPHGQVILMESAHYGRMRMGRCLSTDYQVGCSADVLQHVDGRCSGHQRCTVTVPDPELFGVQPCRKDLVAYFEASYTCVEVSRQTPGCGHPVYLSGSARYIPSNIMMTSSLDDGSEKCHWVFSVQKGQRIRMTLLDFASGKITSDDPWKKRDACPVYAILKESTGVHRVSLCGGGRRETVLYNSTTQYLQVAILGHRQHDVNFMLKFEGDGCPDLETLPNINIQRTSTSALLECEDTGEKWHLVCRGTHWIGEMGNCSQRGLHLKPNASQVVMQRLPAGLVIAIVVGVIAGALLGFAGLLVMTVCLRSFNRRRSASGERLTPRLLLIEALRDVDQENAYKMTIQRHQSATRAHVPTSPTTPFPPPPPHLLGRGLCERTEEEYVTNRVNYQCYCSNDELQEVYKLIREAKTARGQLELPKDARGGSAGELLGGDTPDVCDYGTAGQQDRGTSHTYGVTIANEGVGTPAHRPQPTGGCDLHIPYELRLQ